MRGKCAHSTTANANTVASNSTDIVTLFKLHAAKAFFASAWADACEESDSPDAPSLSGEEIMSVMPDTIDPAAERAAQTLMLDMELENGLSVPALFEIVKAEGDGDRSNTVEMFGHYSAMQAMGHGVGLSDAFGRMVSEAIKVPYCEFGSPHLERDYF